VRRHNEEFYNKNHIHNQPYPMFHDFNAPSFDELAKFDCQQFFDEAPQFEAPEFKPQQEYHPTYEQV